MNGKTLLPLSIITNGAMTGNLVSTVVPIQFQDNIGLQLAWTGSPVGTFSVEVSLDQVTWATLPTAFFSGSTYPVPGTTSSPAWLQLNQCPAAYLRVVYNFTSGSGTLNVLACAKGI